MGKEAVIDILNFRIINSKKIEDALIKLSEMYKNRKMPVLPISADVLMTKYKIPEGKELGIKLKIIEEEWVNNNFKITDQQLENIIKI